MVLWTNGVCQQGWDSSNSLTMRRAKKLSVRGRFCEEIVGWARMSMRRGKWATYYNKSLDYMTKHPDVPVASVFEAVAVALGGSVTAAAVCKGYYAVAAKTKGVSVHKNSKLSTSETSILLTALLRLDATNRPSDRRGVAQLVKEVRVCWCVFAIAFV